MANEEQFFPGFREKWHQAERERAYWDEHFEEVRAQYEAQFVAIHGGNVGRT